MAIMSSLKKEEREKYLGWIQSANGLGLLAGPLLGVGFYQLGGYLYPFIMFGAMYLITYPFIIYYLKSSSQALILIEFSASPTSRTSRSTRNAVRLSQLFAKPRFFFGIWTQMNLLMSLQFLAPNLAVHIKECGFSTNTVGISYAIPALLFALTCPFIYLLTNRISKRGLILTGWLQIVLALSMIGGTEQVKAFHTNP